MALRAHSGFVGDHVYGSFAGASSLTARENQPGSSSCGSLGEALLMHIGIIAGISTLIIVAVRINITVPPSSAVTLWEPD